MNEYDTAELTARITKLEQRVKDLEGDDLTDHAITMAQNFISSIPTGEFCEFNMSLNDGDICDIERVKSAFPTSKTTIDCNASGKATGFTIRLYRGQQ